MSWPIFYCHIKAPSVFPGPNGWLGLRSGCVYIVQTGVIVLLLPSIAIIYDKLVVLEQP